MSVNKIALI